MGSWSGVSIASVDNHMGGRLATQHLLDQGFEHIGHIAGPQQWWEARERRAGWEAALSEGSLLQDLGCWVEGDWTPSSGSGAFEKLLDRHPETDAVFVANDQMAMGALAVACREGLRVPEDLALVGFDDIPEAAYVWPPLTSVRQDQEEFGRRAVRELGRMVETFVDSGELPEPQLVSIQPQLVVRASSIRHSSSPSSVPGSDLADATL